MTDDPRRRPMSALPGGGTPILDQLFDVDSLFALRAAVAAHAAAAGLPQHRADDLVVAVHELAANAVLHGAGHGRLRLWRQGEALRCEVTDDGGPPPRPPGRAPARDRATRRCGTASGGTGCGWSAKSPTSAA